MLKKHKKQFVQALAKPSETTAQFAITAQHFSGPLPPPEMLRKYEDLMPGSAERLVSMAERQSQHRQAIELKVIQSSCTNERLGTIFGFIICLIALGAGMYAATKGKDAFGIAAVVGSLGGLVAVFVYGKSQQRKDLQARQRGTIEAARNTQPR